ncbi:MAG: alkaline phosphatase family protein [Novosphingobium sp.]|nr:alkaline phosphatase family protein [Novosphingobium sp.]
MRKPIASFVLAAAVSMAACMPAKADKHEKQAEQVREMPDEAPQLIVAIAVDQLSADLFAQYRSHFTGGFARLAQGAVFPSGFQSHAATETCPGHSTLLTGVHPARSGIIANNWYAPSMARADKRVYCAEDVTDAQSTSRNPVVSARHLKVPTLGERLKLANPASRNVAVSGKDRAAMMMGGQKTDAVYWWNGSGFATLKGRELSPVAEKENRKISKVIARGEKAFVVPEWCESRDHETPVGDFTIGTWKFPLPRGEAHAFQTSPRFDEATLDVALGLVEDMDLGRGQVPDTLSISFSATDYIGHAFGHEGVEMCIQLAELDKTIGRLFAELDKRGIDYVAVLSSDHGAIDAPERLSQQAYPRATRADASLSIDALGKAVTEKTGIKPSSGPLLLGSGGSGDIYVTAQLGTAEKARVIKALVDNLRRNAQVAEVFTAQELAEAALPSGSPQDWSLKERARASFDAKRSGDVIVMLERAVVPVTPRPGLTTTHGSPWDYDRRVPILFWRRGITGFEQPAPVETIDIAPTLAALLHLTVPENAFDGRCLDIDGSAANICE